MMERNISVSVCVPTIGRLGHLQNAIASLQEAWRPGIEVFILDNSPEQSVTASSFVWSLPYGAPIIIKNGGRLSMAENWNTSFAQGTGEWIHILHDDDWVEPEIYSAFQEDVLLFPPFGLWCGSTNDIYEPDARLNVITRLSDSYADTPESVTEVVFADGKCRCPSVILNREKTQIMNLFDPRFKHSLDIDLFGRIGCQYHAKFSDKIVSNYRVHELSATGFITKEKRIPILEDGRLIRDCRLLLINYRTASFETPQLRKYVGTILWNSAKYYAKRGQIRNLKDLLLLLGSYLSKN